MADLRIIVDPEDEPLLGHYAWYAEQGNRSICIVRKTRSRAMGTHIRIPLAEAILGHKDGFIIDHINGDPFDNRRSNLRHATIAENNRNSKQRKSSTGLRGIRLTPYGKWSARIVFNRKVTDRSFDTREEAIAWRKQMERECFGEFVRAE